MLCFKAMLLCTIQQSESVICVYISLFWIAFNLAHHRAPDSIPCAGQQVLISYLFYTFIHTSKYTSIPVSQLIPPPTFSLGVHYFFPLCLYFCFGNRISRVCMYVLIYGICFSLSDLLHSVSDSPFTWSLLFSLTCVLKVINIHLKLSPALKFPYLCAILQSATYTLNSITHKERVRRNSGKKEQKISSGFFFFFL